MLSCALRLVREIAKEEASNYSPVLVRWNVNAKVVAAATLHELYRGDLKPFLDGVTQLSDDVTAVLPVAEALEAFLMDMTAGEGAACFLGDWLGVLNHSHLRFQWVSMLLLVPLMRACPWFNLQYQATCHGKI